MCSWVGSGVRMMDMLSALLQPSSRVGHARPSAFGRLKPIGDRDAPRPPFAFVNDKAMTGAMWRWENAARASGLGWPRGPGMVLCLCCTDEAMRTSR